MRVPLPGRDYFPARVLLRGMRRGVAEDAPRAPAPRGVAVTGPAAFAWGPSAWCPSPWPAVPPSPCFTVRPAA